jgi:bifunctional DNA-binding transcriptional regulator/antitoxin component of YhaV-PrlF toxin-antitoxin module
MSKPMTITVTDELQRMLPSRVRRTAGFRAGDKLEVKAIGGVVTLISKPSLADDRYTPEQRRSIDSHIAEGLDDINHGRLHGPFETHEEMVAFLHSEVKKVKAKKSSKPKPR